jgi:hypothetical protein
MTPLYLAIRAYLEVVAVAALAAWGWNASGDPGHRLAIAVVTPLLFVAVWSLVVAPRASNSIPQLGRVLIGGGLLQVAAFALHGAGQTGLALAYATLVLLNLVQLLSFAEFGPTRQRQ